MHVTTVNRNTAQYLTTNKKSNSNLDDTRIRQLFESKNFAFLGSLMKDGSPHVTPTWVDIENGNILVNTAIGRIKHRNVSRDPRVALSIIDQNNQYEMVTLRGKVIEQITGDAAEKHIDKLSKKYIGADKFPRRSKGEQRVILKKARENLSYVIIIFMVK